MRRWPGAASPESRAVQSLGPPAPTRGETITTDLQDLADYSEALALSARRLFSNPATSLPEPPDIAPVGDPSALAPESLARLSSLPDLLAFCDYAGSATPARDALHEALAAGDLAGRALGALRRAAMTPSARCELFESLCDDYPGALDDPTLDAVLGLEIANVSRAVDAADVDYGDALIWQSPDADDMPQTDYRDLIQLTEHLGLADGRMLVDLGCGFGRAGFLVGLRYPDALFLGYELVGQRVDEASRVARSLGLAGSVRFETRDLSAPGALVEADHYYVFHSFDRATGRKVAADLEAVTRLRGFELITQDGFRGFDPAEQDWLGPCRSLGVFEVYQALGPD